MKGGVLETIVLTHSLIGPLQRLFTCTSRYEAMKFVTAEIRWSLQKVREK